MGGESPLEQFKIFTLIELPKLFGQDISFTNASLYLLISTVLCGLLCFFALKEKSMIPSASQLVFEKFYGFVVSMVESNAGPSALHHVPFVMTIFAIVAVSNLLSLVPLPSNVATTAHFAITGTLALLVFLRVTFSCIENKGLTGFAKMFLPAGTPLWLAPMMIVIEFFTYITRPISLSIRLAANMIAGHTIIEIISAFAGKMEIYFAWFPLLFVIILTAFEIFVAGLQAYIFVALTCVYLGDTTTSH